MLTGIVCYIERTPGGVGLRRIRLVGPELDQTWVTPSTAGDDGAKASMPGEQLAHLRSAAAWIAEEIAPSRELAAICLDSEGAVCSWVSSPSADPQVVLAALRQVGGGPSHPTGEAAPAATGFGLLPDDASGFGSARSIQALAAPEQKSRGVAPKAATKSTAAPRKRLGVLSIADAPVRVLLDELDKLKISVGSVLSFWHAVSLAWDPGVERSKTSGNRSTSVSNGEYDAHAPIVVAAEAPTIAAIVVDPAGRLTWAWSRKGELIAAGSMRLRTHTFSRGDSALSSIPFSGDHEEMSRDAHDLAPIARRVEGDDSGIGGGVAVGETVQAAECSAGDVGRLVMDWLAWSVQVGCTPERVVCIGPATVSHRPGLGASPPTPVSVAQALVAAWPSATVDAAIHDDPIGATMNRLRALPMFAPARSPDIEAGTDDDPRLNLVALTGRPGRLDRTTHIWATVAILGAAAAVFIYTQRLAGGIEGLRSRSAAVQKMRVELLQSVEDIVPAVSKTADPVGMLSSKNLEYSEQMGRLAVRRPYLPRLLPAIEILQSPEFSNVEITTISADNVRLLIKFSVPEEDSLTPSAIRNKLDERYGVGVWDGAWGSSARGRRPYEVFLMNPGATP